MKVRLLTILLASAAIGGCGKDESERTSTETAQAFVDAVNERDWERVCELTRRFSQSMEECESFAATTFSPVADKMRLEGVYESSDGGTFAVNTPDDFAPTVEREDGVFKVHYEITIIR